MNQEHIKELSNGCALTLKPLGEQYTKFTKQLGKSNDPITPAVHKLKLLDSIIRVLKNEKDGLRNGLMDFMRNEGVVDSDADGYKVSLKLRPKRVVIDDVKALEKACPDYFKPQPAKLDEAALRKLLQHKNLECAHLEEGGDTLAIRLDGRNAK